MYTVCNAVTSTCTCFEGYGAPRVYEQVTTYPDSQILVNETQPDLGLCIVENSLIISKGTGYGDFSGQACIA